MNVKLRVAAIALVAVSVLGLGGCDKTTAVLAAIGVYQQVVTIAQADLPTLQASGILTAGDVTAATNWLTVANTLGTQASACVSGAGGTTSKIVACVNAIGTGLLSPAEQADLRIISPGAQQKVTLYVTAVVLAANGIATIVSAVQTSTPTVGSSSATSTDNLPTREELIALAHRAGVSDDQFAYVGL